MEKIRFTPAGIGISAAISSAIMFAVAHLVTLIALASLVGAIVVALGGLFKKEKTR